MTRSTIGRLGLLAVLLAGPARGAETNAVADPYDADYRAYDPNFGRWQGFVGWDFKEGAMMMKTSSEKSFYTLTLLPESERAYALVAAAKTKEQEGRYGEAIEIYQKVIDEYPETLCRVSPHGVFVPIAQYCQLRLLSFPKEHREFYRTKHDARAKEAFELARQRNSLEGLAQVRDSLLATSYGAAALTTLGYAALDRGNYLEALEYFETTWERFPETRTRDPELAVAVSLCRKMLGLEEKSGERYGLLGHWKLDETSGNRAADSAEHGVHGTVAPVPNWTSGKVGGALRISVTNRPWIAESGFLDIGQNDSDYSVVFWVWLDKIRTEWPGHNLFEKRSADGKRSLYIRVMPQDYGKYQRFEYGVYTEHPEPESGWVEGKVDSRRWIHVAFVKTGREIRFYLDGRLALRKPLRGRAAKIPGPIALGGSLEGMLDDVRLYGRALSDREVAEFAGAAGAVALTASPASGEAPLAVEFASGAAAGDCFWEFGDGATARGAKVQHTYGLGGKYDAVLTVTDAAGAISVGRAVIAVKDPPSETEHRRRLSAVLAEARAERPVVAGQTASPGCISAHDYVLLPPTSDPLGLAKPAWSHVLPAAAGDCHVYTEPVVTERSVVFRHRNIVYCHSILSGQLRWKNDLGGRVSWQDWPEYQHPIEDVLVHDGLVFAPVRRVGPTLAAYDEVTGQLKWAYGPMAASTEEEARMRFLTAPAAGPRAVYAGYVLDNIEGDTHTDTEYGVIAFESTTGRVIWRREICRLRPGKFSAGFAEERRNKIRSFASPPLYRDGTVYYGANAGAIAAIDALSGRIKWVMKYPYYLKPANVHDATVPFGAGPNYLIGCHDGNRLHPAVPFWYNQRPLLLGDALYVTPVDSPFLYRLDRRTGRIQWMKPKEYWSTEGWGGRPAWFLGPMSDGKLVIAYSDDRYGYVWQVVILVDPGTGATVWQSADSHAKEREQLVAPLPHPVLTHSLPVGNYAIYGLGHPYHFHFPIAARPLLTADDRIHVPSMDWKGYPGVYGFMVNLGVLDLGTRKVVDRRHYLDGGVLNWCEWAIKGAPAQVKKLEDVANKDAALKQTIERLKEVAADSVPVNKHGPFAPFSRVTFERFGVPFELRMGVRRVEMVFDRAAVAAAIRDRRDPEGLFARAELAAGVGAVGEAARLLQECLRTVPAEDGDFRAAVRQQLYPVHKELARAAVRAGRPADELAHGLGMSQTVNMPSEEMESLLALSEAYERGGDWASAARLARTLVNRFGQDEYAAPSLIQGDQDAYQNAIGRTLDGVEALGLQNLFGKELVGAATASRKGLEVNFGALSPLPRDLRLRAGELGAARLTALARRFPALRAEQEKEAQAALAKKPPEEQVGRLWEYPGTEVAQQLLDQLLASTEKGLAREGITLEDAAALRRRGWALADAARIGGFVLPEASRGRWLAPAEARAPVPLAAGLANRETSLEDERGTAWLVLERRDGGEAEPDRLFLGGRVKKKLDNKFVLHGFDLKTGQVTWKATEPRGSEWFEEIRLAGKGDEPGFFEAFVFGDIVVTHGRYDVLAFNLADGKLKWRYAVPFAFEIRRAEASGELLALAGQSETIVLYLGTSDPRGEVVWQEKEQGDIHGGPYFVGDRLVSLRKMPFNLTVRYRSTGKLMGRLELPDLLLNEENPLVDKGARATPVAWDGLRMVVTDAAYYYMLDVENMKILWKCPVTANDPTRLPAMRLELRGDYLAVVKRDFDAPSIAMMSSRTGALLWKTDPRDPNSPQPIDSMLICDGKLYGIKPHQGEGFYVVGMDCQTGKPLFAPNEQAGYGGKPDVALRHSLYGEAIVAQVRDRQDFEVKAFGARDGRLLHTLQAKSAGDFGEHGRASAAVQNGRLALLGKDTLVMATPKTGRQGLEER